jgi:hypothetical protein
VAVPPSATRGRTMLWGQGPHLTWHLNFIHYKTLNLLNKYARSHENVMGNRYITLHINLGTRRSLISFTSCLLYPPKMTSGNLWTGGWAVSSASPNALKKEHLLPLPGSNTGSSVVHTVAWALYRLSQTQIYKLSVDSLRIQM